jgi:threonine/homoserine/homoserine lactone efflux protein
MASGMAEAEMAIAAFILVVCYGLGYIIAAQIIKGPLEKPTAGRVALTFVFGSLILFFGAWAITAASKPESKGGPAAMAP